MGKQGEKGPKTVRPWATPHSIQSTQLNHLFKTVDRIMSCQKIPQKNSVLCWVIGNPSIGIIVITVGQFSAFLGMIFRHF